MGLIRGLARNTLRAAGNAVTGARPSWLARLRPELVTLMAPDWAAFAAQGRWLAAPEVRTIFDVGANVGMTTARYRKLFPAATVHAFEPFDASYRQLEAATRGDRSVHAHKLALADAPGARRFHVCRGSQMNSLLPVAAGGAAHMGGELAEQVAVEEVEVTTLDRFCADGDIGHIDILKMDTQGGELLALRGAERLLAGHAVDLIYCEVLFAQLYEGQAEFGDLLVFLRDRGYRLFGLPNLARGGDLSIGFGDAIFLAPGVERRRHGAR